jgi:hypothetical protein
MFQEKDRVDRVDKVVDCNNVLQAPAQKVLDVTVYPTEIGDGLWRFVCPDDWNPEAVCGFIAFRRLDGLVTLLNSTEVEQVDIGVLREAVEEDWGPGG